MDFPLYPLQDYCALLEQQGLLAAPLPGNLDTARKVQLISYDSKTVVPGTLFLCKGAHFKSAYLVDAAAKGAFAYVSEVPYPDVDLPCILVKDMRRTLAPLAILYYNDPSSRLKVIGITGTKGKSSTAYYLKNILDEHLASMGSRCGIISSIDTYDGVEEFESHLTTPEPLDLQRHFANACSSGMEYVVIEASSQALKYHRTLGTHFAAACFLNIGRDHISAIEHPTFEDYFHSKLKIFSQAEMSVVNLDSDHADEILDTAKKDCSRVITFSCKDPSADVYGDQIHKQGMGIFFRVTIRKETQAYQINMPGLFNVENALAAIAVSDGLGIPQNAVYLGLMKARVPGRMEVFSNASGDITAIVDYAHNRLSFETLFHSVLQEYPGRRVVTVFGCPGKKAQERRRDLGEISGQYSDLVVLTEEDSGEEDTVSICQEIASHAAPGGCSVIIEPNRGEAIRKAVQSCSEPSVILITGKGRETRQKRGLAYIDTPSDVQYVTTWLQEYDVIRGLDNRSNVQSLLLMLPQLEKLKGSPVVIYADLLNYQNLLDIAVLKYYGLRIVLFVDGYKSDKKHPSQMSIGQVHNTSDISWIDGLRSDLNILHVSMNMVPIGKENVSQEKANTATSDSPDLDTIQQQLFSYAVCEDQMPVFYTEERDSSDKMCTLRLACKTAELLGVGQTLCLIDPAHINMYSAWVVQNRSCVNIIPSGETDPGLLRSLWR